MNRRKVFILLTQFPDTGSKVMRLITRYSYTHASIGLDEDLNTFYSFVCKGFMIEKITRYLRPDRSPFPCLLYEIEVSEEVYQRVRKLLLDFAARKQSLSYTKAGVILGLSHISYRRKDHFFCSQFVAEILKYGGAAYLKKDSELYFPKDLSKLNGIRKIFQGDLMGMAKQYRLMENPT